MAEVTGGSDAASGAVEGMAAYEPARNPQECHHDDVFQGVCVWCRAEVGTAPTDEQARIVGDLLGVTLTRAATAHKPEGHDWRKSEPATDGATPVWACQRCGLYRTEEPARYDLSRCLRDL